MLHIVKSLRVRLPNVDLHVGNRVAVYVFDGAEHEAGGALRIVGDGVAGRHVGGFVRMEGPEDGAFGGVGGFGVVYGVDEEGEAENIGEEDEFLDLH